MLSLPSLVVVKKVMFRPPLQAPDDYMLTNGTPDAQVSLLKQYVRLRILNAEVEEF